MATRSTKISRPASSGGFKLGRSGMAKLNQIEGLELSSASQAMFQDFDRKGLSPEQRRQAIIEKHAKKA